MANQMQGPFSAQLQQAYEAPRNPAGEAGHGDNLTSIAHAATNFLEGMAKSRLNNQYRAEMQRQRNIQAVTALMQHAENSDLTPAAKQQFGTVMMQRLAHEVAGASGGDKKQDSSNPVVNWFKQAANSIVGPNPGKVAPIDDAFLGQAFQTLQSGPRVGAIQNQALSDLQEAMNASAVKNWEGKEVGVDEMALKAHPKFDASIRALQSAGLGLPDTFKVAMGTRVLSPEQRDRVLGESRMRGIVPQAQVQAPASPYSSIMQPLPYTGERQEVQPLPGGPFAGNAIMQMFGQSPAAQGSGGVPSQQVAPQTSAVTPSTGAQELPPFITRQLTPSEFLDLRKFGGTPEKRYLVNNQVGDGRQYPYLIFPGNPNVPVTNDGKVIDFSKVDRRNYDDSTTAPSSRVEASPEQVKALEAGARAFIKQHPILQDVFGPQVDAARVSRNPAEAFSSVMARMDNHMFRVEQDKDRADAAAARAEDRRTQRGLANAGRIAPIITNATQRVQSSPLIKAAEQSNQIVAQVEQAYKDFLASPNKEKAKAVLGNLDTQITYAKGKISDPGSTVRDSEREAWKAIQGWSEGLKTKLNALINGDGRMFNEITRDYLVSSLGRSRDELRRQAYINAIEPTIKSAQSAATRLGSPLEDEEIRGMIPGDYVQYYKGQSGGAAKTLVDPFGAGKIVAP